MITPTALECHPGNDTEFGADGVYTFLTRVEANSWVRHLGGRVTHKTSGEAWARVPATQGGGWVKFEANQACVVANGRRYLVQVPKQDGVSPFSVFSRKGL